MEKEKAAPKREKRVFQVAEKCQAVLSIWSERRKPSEVCRELSIKWAVLNHWQNRAMEGMMAALEPKRGKQEQRGPALGQKLENLLNRVSQRTGKITKLERRLERIQSSVKKSR